MVEEILGMCTVCVKVRSRKRELQERRFYKDYRRTDRIRKHFYKRVIRERTGVIN